MCLTAVIKKQNLHIQHGPLVYRNVKNKSRLLKPSSLWYIATAMEGTTISPQSMSISSWREAKRIIDYDGDLISSAELGGVLLPLAFLM